MTEQINGRLGDWASKCAKAKPIEVGKKTSWLELFKQGMEFTWTPVLRRGRVG